VWAHVAVFPEGEHEDAFTPRNARDLSQLLADQARHHGPDRALMAALARVRHNLQVNTAGADPNAVGWPLILGAIGVCLGLWLVLGLVQSRLARRQAVREGAPTARERMSPALMGCLFGSLAAGWIYDQLLAHERPARPPSRPSVDLPPVEQPAPAEAAGG
jgi:hypothetical protein